MITITIKTDNAAFHDDDEDTLSLDARNMEVARILRELAEHYDNGGVRNGYPVHDGNGNTVGKVADDGE